ncbi:hypothetical protein GCM10009854_09560 [Saccharopolyspora halophila]|uniref:Uncharacterized protein n=1 Tax=Saccharopolyspora halophila TaxID=405551 RepID=A0ABP5SP80_9PSEU
MRNFKTLLAGAAVAGLALTGIAAPAAVAGTTSAPAPAVSTETPASPITADRYTVRPGERLDITVDHGREMVSWISSAAFVRNEPHPMGLDEGMAVPYNDTLGYFHAKATIADVPPGRYEIRARIGGGTPQPIAITVR